MPATAQRAAWGVHQTAASDGRPHLRLVLAQQLGAAQLKGGCHQLVVDAEGLPLHVDGLGQLKGLRAGALNAGCLIVGAGADFIAHRLTQAHVHASLHEPLTQDPASAKHGQLEASPGEQHLLGWQEGGPRTLSPPRLPVASSSFCSMRRTCAGNKQQAGAAQPMQHQPRPAPQGVAACRCRQNRRLWQAFGLPVRARLAVAAQLVDAHVGKAVGTLLLHPGLRQNGRGARNPCSPCNLGSSWRLSFWAALLPSSSPQIHRPQVAAARACSLTSRRRLLGTTTATRQLSKREPCTQICGGSKAGPREVHALEGASAQRHASERS